MPSSKQRALKKRKPNKRARKEHLASLRAAAKVQATPEEASSVLNPIPGSSSLVTASAPAVPQDSPVTKTPPAQTPRPCSTVDRSEQQAKSSATKRKLTLFEAESSESVDPSEAVSTLPVTIVDLNCLQPLLDGIRCQHCRNGYLTLAQKGSAQGYAVNISLRCTACHHEGRNVWTSPRLEERSFSINRTAVAASLAGGFGYAGMKHFSEFLNMPLLAESSFQHHADKINEKAIDFKDEILDKTSNIVRECYVKEDPALADKSVIDITVSYDGSWHTRGHTSNSGVGCVIDSKTGLVLDYHVMCKFCKVCVTEGANVRKESERAFDEWMLLHKPFCSKNFNLTSGAMEVEAALVCWGRSESRGFRYVNIISDGDCKTVKKINDCRPYGSVEVQKEECVNHVAKRLGKALRDLVETKKKQKITLGGKGEGKLTQAKINKLQKYYTRAIRSNSTLEGMRESVMGTFLHCTSTDENPTHSSCPEGVDSWCFFQRAIARGDPPASHKSKLGSFLSREVAEHVKVVYERMSSDELLSRCLAGKTQNANESLHSVLWTKCPKNIFLNRRRLETSIALAVGEFNQGSAASKRFMELLGLNCGDQTHKLGNRRDQRRAYFADYAEVEKNKSRKKIKDEAKKKELAAIMDQEIEREGGPLYEAGGGDS